MGRNVRKYVTILQIAFRNLFRSPRRSVFALLAITLSVTFVVGMAALFEGNFEQEASVQQKYHLGHMAIYSRAYATLDNPHKIHAVVWGMDLDKETSYHAFGSRGEDGLVEGRYPAGPREVMVGSALLEKLKLSSGDQVVFKIRSATLSDKFYRAKIVGVFETGQGELDSEYMVMPYAILHDLSGYREWETQGIFVYLDDPYTARNMLSDIEESMGPNTVVNEWTRNYFVFAFEQFKVQRILFSIVFVGIASFLLVLTTLMVIKERMKEIGILASMGMTRREMVVMFFYEAGILAFIGSLLGAVIITLWLFIFARNPIVYSIANYGIITENVLNFRFSITDVLLGFTFTLLFSCFISLVPSLRAAFIKPIDALKG